MLGSEPLTLRTFDGRLMRGERGFGVRRLKDGMTRENEKVCSAAVPELAQRPKHLRPMMRKLLE